MAVAKVNIGFVYFMVRIYKDTKKGSKLFVRIYLDEDVENTQENKESIVSYFITAREMFLS